MVQLVAVEEVWDEHDGACMGGEVVGALEGLGCQAEDVEDVDDALERLLGPDHVCERELVKRFVCKQDEAKLDLHVLNPAMVSYVPLGV